MAHVSVTRRYRFSASHRLHSPLLDESQNRAVYGKCNNPYGHGHDYVLDVTIGGELDTETGRLVPLSQLDLLVETAVLQDLKWHNLNTDVAEFVSLVPTTENLARVIASRLAAAWHVAFPSGQAKFEKVRIYETRNNIFEALNPARDQAKESRKKVSELQEIR